MAKSDISVKLGLNSKQFDDNIKRSKQQLNKWSRDIQVSNKSISVWNSTLSKSTLAVSTWLTGLVSVGAVIGDTTRKNVQFEKSLSSLRALTGVTADELQYFKGAALQLGATTTQSASQVVNASFDFRSLGA